ELPARTALRQRPARLRTRRFAQDRGQDPPAVPRHPRQGRARAPGAADRGGARSRPALPRRARKEREGWRDVAVSGGQRDRSSDPTGLRPGPETRGRGGGAARRPGQPACAAPRLCEPPSAERRRSSRHPGAFGPRRHLDDADLHPRPRRAAEEHGARPAPDGRRI
ncbi:MAG: Site-specific tyrosine recombinase XerD, partial [uncultured Microvirga sp.]